MTEYNHSEEYSKTAKQNGLKKDYPFGGPVISILLNRFMFIYSGCYKGNDINKYKNTNEQLIRIHSIKIPRRVVLLTYFALK